MIRSNQTAGPIYRLLFLVILIKPVSNLVFAFGLKTSPEALSVHPLAYLQSMAEPVIALGIALQIVWLLSRMALLSRADLSFVLPATASGYAISALLGKLFLAERISPKHWMGIALICLGSSFVSFTRRSATTTSTSLTNKSFEGT
ncbi:MAG TPA: hypothetical protein VN633_16375 [Bryobacteraceae bacterium]|nr:hypothetical protein [Bryobacteraceae bacterium]